MKILIIYPHGLGDCILCTPALKKLKKDGHFIGFAMLKRFETSQLFEHNPNIDKIYYTKDAWNDYPSFKIGCEEIEKSMQLISQQYDKTVFIKHSKHGSKIIDCADALFDGCLNDFHTEIYPSEDDIKIAEKYVEGMNQPFGFVHSKTGVPKKDLPEGYGKRWLYMKFHLNRFIEVDKTFKQEDFNINVQFEIMRRARAVCLADSVFYHACNAMDKPVDFVYFARGKEIYDRVHPLHSVKENIVYKL